MTYKLLEDAKSALLPLIKVDWRFFVSYIIQEMEKTEWKKTSSFLCGRHKFSCRGVHKSRESAKLGSRRNHLQRWGSISM